MADFSPVHQIALVGASPDAKRTGFANTNSVIATGCLTCANGVGGAPSGDAYAGPMTVYTGYASQSGGDDHAVFDIDFGAMTTPDDNSLNDFGATRPGSAVRYPDATVANSFAEGTMIATPQTERPVETLQAGDRVRTADGRSVKIERVGRRRVHPLFCDPRSHLVRIRSGALGGGLPHTDLTVTGDHGVVLHDLQITASALTDIPDIDWVPLDALDGMYTVHHVETETHEMILANGVPSKSCLDRPGRQVFDNYAESPVLHGRERGIGNGRIPRIACATMLPRALQRRLGIDETPMTT